MKKLAVLVCVFLAVLFVYAPKHRELEPFKPQIKKEKELLPFVKKLLDLHNEERSSRGYEPLETDSRLCEYAQKHAEKMSKEERLAHSGMTDLQSGSAGENIAWGQKTEDDVVNAWMWSPGHRWNILESDYRKAGFGMAKDSDGRIYWCVVFSD